MKEEKLEDLLKKLETLQSNLIILSSEVAQVRTDLLKAEIRE